MRRILLYLSNILGAFLISIFSIVLVTENTDIVNRYYKDDIKSQFENRTDLNANFESLSVQWNGVNPSIIIKNFTLDEHDNELLISEQLIIRMGLKITPENISFTIKELDLVRSNLSIQYNDNKILINNHDIFEALNSEGRDYQDGRIKLRLSNSVIKPEEWKNLIP